MKQTSLSRISSTPATNDSESKIFVAIVSHGHDKIIKTILKPHEWPAASKLITPVILSNLPCKNLKEYCRINNLTYIENLSKEGFGANNNKIFNHLHDEKLIGDNDYFYAVNPDIATTSKDLVRLAELMKQHGLQIAAPNLKNENGTEEDNIREFPAFLDTTLRLLLKSKRTDIDKRSITTIQEIPWASGAFLCFLASTYRKLQGFDERYYMYYEDADICRRAQSEGIPTSYIPQISAIHLGARKSRSLLSKEIIYHCKSAFRFNIMRKNK